MRRIGAFFAGLLLPAAIAAAASLSVTTSVAPVPIGTPATVQVLVSGGDAVESADVLLFVGDGGPGVGGTDNPATAPHIVGGDITTGIFAGNNAGNNFFNLDVGNGPEPLVAGNFTVTNSGSVVADGLLATFELATTNAAPGSYVISINADNTFINGAPVQIEGSAMLTIVPEPASALLLLGALPFLRRRTA